MKLEAEFVRLPLSFDAERLAQEVKQFTAADWIPHPDGDPGNFAVPLITAGGGINNRCHGLMKPTVQLERCTYIRQVMGAFGEIFGRSRLMRLDAGCEVLAHVDYHHHWHTHVRIHIPVLTQPEVEFHCGGKTVHMGAAQAWIFDSSLLHRVVNGGNTTRVHLVIDTAGSARFWSMVEQSLEALRHGMEMDVRHVPFAPGFEMQVETERFNLLPVMPPGEVDGLTQDLIGDFTGAPENDPFAVAQLVAAMRAFCREWRVLWHRHGFDLAGLPAYRALLQATEANLPHFDRPLVVRGSRCHVREIYVNKVLTPAIVPELFDSVLGASAPAPVDARADESGRNVRCPCGSGRRFKHCHGAS
jgi:hypothetical protein